MQAIDEISNVRLFVIDPIVEVVNGDMHRSNDVRRSFSPLVELAEQLNIAVVGMTRYAKNTHGRESTERVLGSQAFAALARLVMGVALKEGAEHGILTRTKSNIGKVGDGFEYNIESISFGNGIEATRTNWGVFSRFGLSEATLGQAFPQHRPNNRVCNMLQHLANEFVDK
jgi:putative DNA primase/helicase